MLDANTLIKDRYLIQSYIHKGGMGAVYKAHDQLRNRAVAIKESFYSDRDSLREQFKREATLLARLDHPALPKVHDYFTEGAGQFLVMDCIEGEDLEMLLKRMGRPFALDQVLSWAGRLLDTLDYIHTHRPPVVHRDIKPANLKLTPKGEIILLDFGLAKNATTPTLPGGSLHGYTLAYASPEQRKGAGTDARSDIYSLGATLYRLLTSQEPVNSEVREEVINNGVRDPLKPAHDLNPKIHPSISAVLQRALKLDREERFATAAEMREALRLATEATVAITKPTPEPPRPQPNAQPALQPLPVNEETVQRAAPEPKPIPQPIPSPVPMLKSSRSRIPLVIAGVLASAIVALIAYWLMYSRRQSAETTHAVSPAPAAVSPTPLASPTPETTAMPPPPRTEVLSYSLELEDDFGRRVSGLNPIKQDKRFQFHFTPRENGYLYLIAPGEKSELTAFISGQSLKAKKDFRFPDGDNWINLKNTKSVSFTVVFTPEPVEAFRSLRDGRVLTEAQKNALAEIRRQSANSIPETTAEKERALVTASVRAGEPVIFDITVSFKTKGS
jgi:serine/threonine protein kinase